MTEDRSAGTGPEPGAAPPKDKRRTARELYRELDGPADERFRRSLAGFSRRVGERVAQQSVDPQEAAQARRVALREYDEARARRLKTIAGGAGAVVVTLSVASLIVFIAAPDTPSPDATARSDRTTVVEVAAANPVPDPGPPPPAAPPPPPSLMPVATPQAATALPAAEKASFAPAAITPSPAPAPLRRDEILEVQRLLWAFGFRAGPVDGAAGPTTRAAVVRYRQDRGLPPMGDVDRELLDQLRQDPAPKIAAPSAPPPPPQRPAYAYSTASTGGGSSNPFDAMRRDFIRFQQWLQSQ